MSRLSTAALSGAVVGLLAFGGVSRAESPRTVVRQVFEDAGVSSAAVVLFRNGKRIFAEGFGERDRRRATTRTLIPLGALAEPILGAVVLESSRAGVFDLDSPVSACGPTRGGRIQSRTASRPSPWHLLSHTSGLVQRSGSTFLLFEPGTAWRPSADGIACLKLLLERAEGAEFASVAERRTLRPLGLRSTALKTVDGTSSVDDLARFVASQLSASPPSNPFAVLGRADEQIEWGAGWALFEEAGERLFARVGGEGNLVSVVAGGSASKDAVIVWVQSPQGPEAAHATALLAARSLLDRPLVALDRRPLALAPSLPEPAAEPHHHHPHHP